MCIKKNVLVSVIIPVYNGEKFIAKSVNSILEQTYQNVECIVIDDCSTDSTKEIIHLIEDERLILLEVKPHNKGPGNAYNLGISKAKGKYIAIMHADDMAYPNRIALQVKYLEEHEHVDILGGHVEIKYLGIKKFFYFFNNSFTGVPKYQLSYSALTIITPPFPINTLMTKASLLKQYPFDGSFLTAEDFEWHNSVSEKFTAHTLAIPLCTYYIHGSNNSIIKKADEQRNVSKVYDKIFNVHPPQVATNKLYYLSSSQYKPIPKKEKKLVLEQFDRALEKLIDVRISQKEKETLLLIGKNILDEKSSIVYHLKYIIANFIKWLNKMKFI